MKQSFLIFGISIFCWSIPVSSLKLDRVILGCDLHREYIDFWPLVAKAWQQVVGVKPTLALIAPADIYIDESVGDVIRFDPIPGIPTHTQAQTIRLLLPALFPDDGCLISDMDMIPCSASYFIDSITQVADDCFVVYRDKAYPPGQGHYPMCYNAAKGKVFGELFNIRSREDIIQRIREWNEKKLGWNTDECMLYDTLAAWPPAATRCVRLGHSVFPRINRGAWHYNPDLVKRGHYVDAHCPKPYSEHINAIDTLAHHLSIDYHYANSWVVPRVFKQHSISSQCCYLVPLFIALTNTQGPVLEMGTDDYGTPLLHYWCQANKRFLGTCEAHFSRLGFFSHLLTDTHILWLIMPPGDHQMRFPTINKWDNEYHARRWSIVLVNHTPVERRYDDLVKMRNHSDVFIVVDPDLSIKTLADTYTYKYFYDRYDTPVLIMSDTVDCAAWFVRVQ